MITIGQAQAVICQWCDLVVIPDPNMLQGCGCDPDSPTWVGIERNGRLLSFSQSNYEIIIKSPQEHNYD